MRGVRSAARGRLQFQTRLLQADVRSMLALAALALVARGLWHGSPLASLGGALVAMLLLLIAQAVPVAWTRERPLTFLAPLVFATVLWLGPTAAALGVLLACFFPLRLGPRSANPTRGDLRFPGAPLALAAFAGSVTLTLCARWLSLRLQPDGSLLSLHGMVALRVLAATAFGALAFTAANILLSALANLEPIRTQWRSAGARAYLANLALIYALGMLTIVLLSLFAAAWGPAVVLPLTLALLLGAQMVRKTLEVASLRGQLEAAEAMGRASIADPATDRDPAVLLYRFLTLARTLVDADRALVWTLDQETRELTPVTALPDLGVFVGQKAVFGEGLIGRAAARTRPRLIADAARDPRRGEREVASGAWLLYPILVHERLLGVAQWIRPVARPFTSEDVARLASLVPQAAVALENLRIRERMHNLASTDGLTGLWNHRRMHDLLRDEMRRSARYLRGLSVLMLDVDSFKTFNDTYGHPQGDQLLRSIATILHDNIRTVDHLGRYGGEEFLIILPETPKDDACRLAERIRHAVEEQAFVLLEDGQAIHRTVSVGVASYPEDALNPTELVQRADDALYRAKRAGKNRVLWA